MQVQMIFNVYPKPGNQPYRCTFISNVHESTRYRICAYAPTADHISCLQSELNRETASTG